MLTHQPPQPLTQVPVLSKLVTGLFDIRAQGSMSHMRCCLQIYLVSQLHLFQSNVLMQQLDHTTATTRGQMQSTHTNIS